MDDSTIYGGQQMMGVRAAEALVKDGFAVSFVYYSGNSRLGNELKTLCEFHKNFHIVPTSVRSKRLQALRLFFDWQDIVNLKRLIKKISPSMVFAVQGDIEIGSKCLIASRLARVKVVSYIPFAHSARKKGQKLAFFRDLVHPFLYRIPNAFITSATLVAEELKRISGRPVCVVRDGISDLKLEPPDQDKKQLRDEFNLPQNKFIAAIVARIQFKHKGHDFLVGVAKQYASEMSSVRFLIVGDGPDEAALRASISEAGLDAQFIFMPWQNNSLVVMNAIDLLLMPSVFEGVPLIMLEAMQRRCPILASCTDGMKEVLPTEMLYKPGAKDEFMSKFKKYVDNEIDNLEQLLELNEATQKENFSLDSFGHNFTSAYRFFLSQLI